MVFGCINLLADCSKVRAWLRLTFERLHEVWLAVASSVLNQVCCSLNGPIAILTPAQPKSAHAS